MGLIPSPAAQAAARANGPSLALPSRPSNGNSNGKQPVDVQSLLQRQAAARAAEEQPKFMSKRQREELAAREAAAAAALASQKEREAQVKHEQRLAAALAASQETSRQAAQERQQDSRRGKAGYRGRGRGAFAAQSSRETPNLPYDGPPATDGSTTKGDDSLPVVDKSLLATRYLGANVASARSGSNGSGAQQRKRLKGGQDKKFLFDWNGDDDTGANEYDPLYKQRIEGAIAAAAAAATVTRHGTRAIDQDDQPLAGPSIKKITEGKGIMDERHWSQKSLKEMRERDWRIFREDFSIASRGGHIPLPIRSWRESAIPEDILAIVDDMGYKDPSAIQRQAIPIGLQNRDLIGIAETGSGKTAAFVIPALAYIGRLPPITEQTAHLGPYALILAPTRELAQQIESEARRFTSKLGYKVVSIVGGRAVEEQAFNMKDGCEIVIATPGRLKDCIERHILVLSQCTYVVMDEADRMISLGFEDVLNFILDSLPVSNIKPDTEEAEEADAMLKRLNDTGSGMPQQLYRQTVMFSATMPPACERLARAYLRRPAIVTIGVAGQAVDTVEQRVEFIHGEEKKKHRLLELLNSGEFQPPVIVFVNQKKSADGLAKDINRGGWRATTLHSGKNQIQREEALASLRSGEMSVLVATDLAGRGIDVPDVSLVINFQMANNIESYVHRIGRTGRAGRTGVAVTFLTNDDDEVMYDLKQEISKSPISKVPPELARHEAAQTKFSAAMKRRAQDMEAEQ
ncbi:uncharacterized protein L969DRAFT_18141 [Mixia osmundae IAM 14324]|uniref:uncharacterized protein n=1 Tax=Mixia osmundae (strain CBS 9802 / IAM 14324 / JCM 22182 / KY 12970) TaxID=764103 RepID=UPI0004A549A4|nr:uncharacterized protein L969DRAFT_18141 [Mixia osmundae IAM 14324]KEI39067.1 hypothetical protein L969DRAFT_18141 [Mixia osmundae IAM 14324]